MQLFHSSFLLCLLLLLTKSACHSSEEPSDTEDVTDDNGDDDANHENRDDDDFVDLDFAKHVRGFESWNREEENSPENGSDYDENDGEYEQEGPDEEDTNDEVSYEEEDADSEGDTGEGESVDEKKSDDDGDEDVHKNSEEESSDEEGRGASSEDPKQSEDKESDKFEDQYLKADGSRDKEHEGDNGQAEYEGKGESSGLKDAWRHRHSYGYRYYSSHSHKNHKICTTRDCVVTAAEILRDMDMSVNPCDNFYDFVCGRFAENHQIRDYQGKLHSFALLRDQLAYDLHNIIDNLNTEKSLGIVRNVKHYYSSCLNLKHREKVGDQPQIKLVQEFFNWPIKKPTWPGESWNIKLTLKKLVLKLGVNPLFSSGVSLDDKKASQFIFKVTEPGLNLPKSYYKADTPQHKKTVDGYKSLIKNLFRKYGQKDNLEETADEIFEFEKKLAHITMSGVQARDVGKVYKKMSVKAFDKIIPEVGFKDLMTAIYAIASKKKKDRGSEKIVVINVDYFKKLSHLLKISKKSSVAKYLVWNVIVFLGHFGPESTQSFYQDFRRIYVGTDVSVPRWKSCLGTVSAGPLGMIIGRLYVQKKFSKKKKMATSRLVRLIRNEFINNLKKIHWMDAKTRKAAKKKARSILAQVAYPDWILDDAEVEKTFGKLKLDTEDYMGNFFKDQNFIRRLGLAKLIHKKRDRKVWTTSPAVVNAFYSETYNRITIPAGILQPPFSYSHQVPRALLFGGIGTVVGHELTHGFDDNGRKYDKDGNYRSWWTAQSSRMFKRHADCIRKQYSRYQEYGAHINGALTAGENIADNGGVKVAYYAMKRDEKRRRRLFNIKLPGLHFTNEQFFFIGFSRLWCTINRKAFTLQRIATDHHTVSKYRVLGVLSNMKEFSRAFKCPRKSKMNPKKKCSIW